MVTHFSQGNAIGAVDGPSALKISAHVAEAFNHYLGAMTLGKNQIVDCAHVVNTFADCLKGDHSITFPETLNFGNSEAGHD